MIKNNDSPYFKEAKVSGLTKKITGLMTPVLHANQCLNQACEDVNSWARGTGILKLHEPTVQN